jgi:hypothetical protein
VDHAERGPVGPRARRAPEALLEVVDAGLELGDAVLQLVEVALENLAAARLVGEPRLDPPKRLEDRLVFLLEPLEPTVDLVEAPEHLLSQLGDHLGEPELHRVEPAVDLGELTPDRGELPPDVGELPPEEFDELAIFGGGRAPSLAQEGEPFTCVRPGTCAARNRCDSGVSVPWR